MSPSDSARSSLLIADQEGQSVAFQWRQHLASLARASAAEWAPLDVRRVRPGIGFTVSCAPAVDVLKEALQAGSPLACTGLALALEILQWFEP